MKLFRVLMMYLSVLLLFSCNKDSCTNAKYGTIKNLEGLDGCGLVIQLEDGTTLIPMNLEDFDLQLKAGSTVAINYTIKTEVMGICMAGDMAEINCIVLR